MMILLSLLAADPVVRIKVDHPPVVTAEPAARSRSPYRLDPNVAGPADGKNAALETTGDKCATAARLCTRKPRAIYAASY